jgi:hypothetical protein
MAEAFGLHVSDLPVGTMPLEVVGAVKVLNEDGHTELWGFQSKDLTFWEAVGMLSITLDQFQSGLVSINFIDDSLMFLPEDDDEEDD